jgi:MinD superfamily P-loop ATPase
MKQLVILSGKGGTGKTSVTAAFAHLAAESDLPVKAVLADADVDAANLELVLAPEQESREDFWGGQVAEIDLDLCSECGICIDVCRFDALGTAAQSGFRRLVVDQLDVYLDTDLPIVDPIACDGCAACVYQCPDDAITMQPQMAGEWFRSQSRYGTLFHAALRPAQENSGKLVTLVKQYARLLALDEDIPLVLVDGPPGIGCPVISAVSGANLALIVAEPTAAGVHDMRRVLQTTDHFGVQAMVCINKADIYPEGAAEIEAFCREQGIEVAGRIPFDLTVTEAMVQAQPVTAFRPDAPASQAIREVWGRVVAALELV